MSSSPTSCLCFLGLREMLKEYQFSVVFAASHKFLRPLQTLVRTVFYYSTVLANWKILN